MCNSRQFLKNKSQNSVLFSEVYLIPRGCILRVRPEYARWQQDGKGRAKVGGVRTELRAERREGGRLNYINLIAIGNGTRNNTARRRRQRQRGTFAGTSTPWMHPYKYTHRLKVTHIHTRARTHEHTLTHSLDSRWVWVENCLRICHQSFKIKFSIGFFFCRTRNRARYGICREEGIV